MFVVLGPVILRGSIRTLVRGSNVCTGSSRVLKTVSFLGIVRQALDSYWDFTNGDVVLLARGEVADLVLEKGLESIRITRDCQVAIVAVRGTEF
jgi:hypothetical protein